MVWLGKNLSVSTVREMFSRRDGDESWKHFRNRRNDLPRVTRDTFWHSLWFRYFLYLWVGTAISFFEAAEPREKVDLQAVALIYKYWEMN